MTSTTITDCWTADAAEPTVEEVHAILTDRGVNVTMEWPGALALRLDPSHDVWTGLCGWDYGTLNVLDPDGSCWQPLDAPADVEVPDGSTASQIADAWQTFALRWTTPTARP